MPAEDRLARSLAIAAGGAAGAFVRWGVVQVWPPGSAGFDWPILVCNIVGSLVLGAALAEEWQHPVHRRFWHGGVAIGFCGGLTTMSTFALEIARLQRDGSGVTALGYLLVSVATCVVAVTVGAALMGRLRALAQPVEEEV